MNASAGLLKSGGWPGVFRPLRHHVKDDAWRLWIDGEWVWFAACGSPCWSPDTRPVVELPWCPDCRRTRRQQHG